MPRQSKWLTLFGWLNLLAAIAGGLIGGCAGPSGHFDNLAERYALQRKVMPGTAFQHVVYWQRPVVPEKRRSASLSAEPCRANKRDTLPLRIYLGSDGTPWLQGRWPSRDPTPREPVTLRWLAQDPGPAVLVGRPCYHGQHQTAGCSSLQWTAARYSARTVASMRVVIAELMRETDRQAVLIGYSGGGVLAVLLAELLPNVCAVVTVAANLDTAAWTARHDYLPLTASLNPAERPPLAAPINQLHLAGARDRNVPSAIIRAYANRQPKAAYWVLPAYTHSCCWPQVWPAVLAWMRTLDCSK